MKKWSIYAIAMLAVWMLYTGCDLLSVDKEGRLKVGVEAIPAVPDGFPIYPTGVGVGLGDGIARSMIGGLDIGDIIADELGSECVRISYVNVCIDDIISGSGLEDVVNDAIDDVEEFEEWAVAFLEDRLNFRPSISIGDTINSVIGGVMRGAKVALVSNIDLTFDLTNNTPVPIRFGLNIGTQDSIAAGTALITTGQGEDYTVDLMPGETTTVTVENADAIVEALNDFGNLAIDYKAQILLDGLGTDALDWLQNISMDDSDDNGIPDDIELFNLSFSNFLFDVSLKSEFSIVPPEFSGAVNDFLGTID
jgi:hypothetical protein